MDVYMYVNKDKRSRRIPIKQIAVITSGKDSWTWTKVGLVWSFALFLGEKNQWIRTSGQDSPNSEIQGNGSGFAHCPYPFIFFLSSSIREQFLSIVTMSFY